MVNSVGASRPQNHLKCLLKQGKMSQHHNWPRHMDWPQIGPKSAIKLGKKRQKDKWYLFRAWKGQMVNSGFQDPKTSWILFQQRWSDGGLPCCTHAGAAAAPLRLPIDLQQCDLWEIQTESSSGETTSRSWWNPEGDGGKGTRVYDKLRHFVTQENPHRLN